MTETPIYGQTAAAQQGGQFTPAPVNPQPTDAPSLEAQVEALVAARLTDVEAKYADRVAKLEAQLEAANARGPIHLIAEHAGGPGYDLADTWSMWHQELARKGELTPEILAAAGAK